ncbi:MAG: phenylalanine--tRNA ligase subunit beta [Pseudomonadota bacterium]
MKFSEHWLRQWVDPRVDTDELVQQITMAGLEVDAVEPAAGVFTGVVVARVEQVDKHPNAEKLSVCIVHDGTEDHQVVCGAPNVRPGLLTAFARVGAVLPDNFKIKKAKLRQVESFGMLCSAEELGLGDDADGIMELPGDLAPGADLRQALTLDDRSIEVDLTPNRGDCLSLRGLAREVGVLNGCEVTPVSITPVAPTHDGVFPVRLSEPEACPRYLGRVIRNVDPSRPSPLWLSERLRRSGLRSIDPIVDVTNYILLELGQPLHAFDLDRLNDSIDVRYAQAGESLTLLDGKTVSLDEQTLLICDGGSPVAMAGVMGGAQTAVSEATRHVFLECAFFAPLAIAGTARRYGMHTDASHRYERGVDPELQAEAIERATALLIEIAGGEPGPVFAAVEPSALPARAVVTLRESRLNRLAGTPIAATQVDELLERLDFRVQERNATADGVVWRVQVPSHRFDVSIEADLVEEVLRIFGYNRVPTRRPTTELPLAEVTGRETPVTGLRRQLTANGFQEVVTYSFIDPELLAAVDPDSTPMTLANPMSQAQSVMRTTLIPALLDVWRTNRARQQQGLRVFELGQCFKPAPAGGDGDAALTQPLMLGGLLAGVRDPESWFGSAAESLEGTGVIAGATDFFDLKGVVERLLAWQGFDQVTFARLADDPALHPGQAATVSVAGRLMGRLGRVHPALEDSLDLGQPVFVFELNAEQLLARDVPSYRPVSRFPSVRRDLALIVGREVPVARVRDIVVETVGARLVDFTVFDIYTGKGIESTEKSVAVGLTIQDSSATLTDAEIGVIETNVLEALGEKLGARLRA